jgi:sugar O-acyltransferase (sialic acid O-acetyltransferase NeuD family)
MSKSSDTKRLVIIGARVDGSAKVLRDIIRLGKVYEVVGFLDDDAELWTREVDALPVFGGLNKLEELKDRGVSCIAMAMGDNRLRETILKRALACDLTPINAIHPRATVAESVKMGAGIWVAAGAVINPGSVIGDGVVVNTGATIDHDCVVSDYANISPGCHLSGRTSVGRYAFLGTGAITLPDVVVGEGAVVGAGTVVLHEVPPGARAVGVPARMLKNKQ